MSPSDAPAFEADYFDGRATARRRVRVARDGATVRIAGEGVALAVPLASLRYQPRVGSLPLRIGLPDAGLLVADADAVSPVLPVPRAASLAQRLEGHTGMLYGSIAGVVVAFVLGWQYGVPWLAEKATAMLPADVEAELSDEGLKSLDRYVFRPSDLTEDRREALRKPFAAMLAQSGTQATLLFRNGEWLGPNAFALPGAKIVMTDQLVAAMGDDDDLVMAVLAHEIGHVAHRHTMRALLQSSFVALGSVLVLGDVSSIAGIAATIPTVVLHNAYSRDFEREADRFAFELLPRTGRSPRLFAQALSRIEASVAGRKGREDVPSFLSTHPATKERVRAARDAASP